LNALGTHSILELYDCPAKLLNDPGQILDFAREAARRARCTVLTEASHCFEPQGVTAILLLAESHLSVHTWPEVGYAAIDVFTCGQTTRPREACQYLARMLEARRQDFRQISRGQQAPEPHQQRLPIPQVGGQERPLAAAEG